MLSNFILPRILQEIKKNQKYMLESNSIFNQYSINQYFVRLGSKLKR